MPGLFALDGSLNVTAVDGSDFVGLYAVDGSMNVVEADGNLFVGLFHASGAMNVTVVEDESGGLFALDGSRHVIVDGDPPMGVTVVSGSLGDDGGEPPPEFTPTFHVYGF